VAAKRVDRVGVYERNGTVIVHAAVFVDSIELHRARFSHLILPAKIQVVQ
jgi:hypothetical protein